MPWNSGQTFGYGSLAGMGVATIINAFGSIGITNKSNAILQSQANIARLNAKMMEFNAQQRLRSAEKDQVRLTMQAGQVKGSQKAAIAANGLATNEGRLRSPVRSSRPRPQPDQRERSARLLGYAYAGRRLRRPGSAARGRTAIGRSQFRYDASAGGFSDRQPLHDL